MQRRGIWGDEAALSAHSSKNVQRTSGRSDRSRSERDGLVGHEPPLTLTENSRAALKRGTVSWRWLGGASITGICGAALIGGALMTSVDGAIHFAQPLRDWRIAQVPESRMGLGDRNSSTAKSDKLDVAQEAEISRKVIQTTEVRRIAKKEFISIRPYELVTIPLAPAVTEISDDLPPFNPLKIFAEGGIFSAPERAAPETQKLSDSDMIAVETIAFAEAGEITFDKSDALKPQEIAAAVRDAVPFELETDIALEASAVAPTTAGIAFASFSSLSNVGRFREVRTPANETVVTKTPAELGIEDADSVSVVTVASGDTLFSMLAAAGVDSAEARVVTETLRPVFSPSELQPGQQLHLALDTASNADDSARLIRMSLFGDGAHIASVRRGVEEGTYAVLDSSAKVVRPIMTANAAPSSRERASIYKGLYEAGTRHDIPSEILNRIVQVHSYDVDFQRAVQAGDSFSAFFELPDESGAPPDPLPLYISMIVRGEGRGFYKFRTPDDGVVDYYDAEGRSAKKFLIRKPMNGGRFRSGFGMRRHPILRSRRLHKGVDWSAPRGTPIVAAGNGTVIEAKWKSGYGNWVKLRHANGYETNYAHMTRRAKGLAAGQRVRQGQIIGYVGSTGLSTGPHLHYEVEVNGRHVDPLRIRLPRGRVLKADILTAFQKELARIDSLMAKPPAQSTLARRPEPSARQFANR